MPHEPCLLQSDVILHCVQFLVLVTRYGYTLLPRRLHLARAHSLAQVRYSSFRPGFSSHINIVTQWLIYNQTDAGIQGIY